MLLVGRAQATPVRDYRLDADAGRQIVTTRTRCGRELSSIRLAR